MSDAVFSARWLVTDAGVVEWARIAVDGDGVIVSIERVDAGGAESTTIAPTFFDVHVHGAAGHDVMEGSGDAFDAIGRFLGTHGVGRFLATTVTAPLDTTLRALDAIARRIESSGGDADGAVPVGIHLEGPFLSHAKRGVHPAAEICEPSVPLFERMWQASHGTIRLMTVAPEIPGALELIRHASGLGVRVSLGHSDATAAEARAGMVAGAVSATHMFNAMRRLDHREPGLAGVVLDEDQMWAELICDGVHVAPEFVRLWMRAKGEERGILVTDGISATGMPEGEYDLGGLTVAVGAGRCLLASDLARGVETLAGSVLTMDRAVENLRRFTGCTLPTAVRMATRNPARMLGLDAAGEIGVGQRADFNVFSAEGTLRETVCRGQIVARH